MTTDRDVEATEYYKTECGAISGFVFNSAVFAWDNFNHAEALMAVTGDISGGFGVYRDAQEIHGRAGSEGTQIVFCRVCLTACFTTIPRPSKPRSTKYCHC